MGSFFQKGTESGQRKNRTNKRFNLSVGEGFPFSPFIEQDFAAAPRHRPTNKKRSFRFNKPIWFYHPLFISPLLRSFLGSFFQKGTEKELKRAFGLFFYEQIAQKFAENFV